MKKLSIFVASYFVITMGWAYSWHMVLFHDLYVEWGAFQRSELIMLLGSASIVIQGIVMAYLYPFYNKIKTNQILRGIKFSLIIGLMTYTAMGFTTAAKFNIDPIAPFLIYHTIFQTIQFVLTGAALGYIFKTNVIEKE